MSNTLPHKHQGRSLEDLKTSLRAVNRQIDDLKIEAAIIMGILPLPEGKFGWSCEELDWDNPKLSHLRQSYFELTNESEELNLITGRMEAERTGNLSVWEAEQKGLKFLKEHCPSFEDEICFFKKNGLVRGRMSLRDAIVENPDYLEEVIL